MYPHSTVYDTYEVVFRFKESPVKGNQYYFVADSHINTRILRSVELVLSTTGGVSRSSGLTHISSNKMLNGFLTLQFVKSNGEPDAFVKQMPFTNLVRSMAGSRLPEFRKRVNVEKCFIEFSHVTELGEGDFIVFYFHLEPIQ